MMYLYFFRNELFNNNIIVDKTGIPIKNFIMIYIVFTYFIVS